MKGLGSLLYESFVAIMGWPIAIVGLLLTVGTFWFGPEAKIAVGWFVLFVSFLLISSIILFQATFSSLRRSNSILPKAKRWTPAPASYANLQGILLIEPSDMFAMGCAASIYYRDGIYEVFIGTGYVINVQDNRIIQIGVADLLSPDPAVATGVANNDAAYLDKLIVKPTIQYERVQ